MTLREHAGRSKRRAVALAHSLSGRSRRSRERLDGSTAMLLMYHRVLPREIAERDAVEPGMWVSPATFERHLDWLQELFDVLPLHEVATRLRDERPLPRNACAITFDDGWRDNLVYAAPLLEARGLPATIFVVSERVGTRGAFWPDEVSLRWSRLDAASRRARAIELGVSSGASSLEAVLEHLKRVSEAARPALLDKLRVGSDDLESAERDLLDWGELEALSRKGFDVESHGASHAILTGLEEDEVRRELSSSLESLRERGHGRHGLFAYPSGAYDSRTVALAREAGYAGAVTTRNSLAGIGCDPLQLPRLGLHEDISASRNEFLRWVPGPADVFTG